MSQNQDYEYMENDDFQEDQKEYNFEEQEVEDEHYYCNDEDEEDEDVEEDEDEENEDDDDEESEDSQEQGEEGEEQEDSGLQSEQKNELKLKEEDSSHKEEGSQPNILEDQLDENFEEEKKIDEDTEVFPSENQTLLPVVVPIIKEGSAMTKILKVNINIELAAQRKKEEFIRKQDENKEEKAEKKDDVFEMEPLKVVDPNLKLFPADKRFSKLNKLEDQLNKPEDPNDYLTYDFGIDGKIDEPLLEAKQTKHQQAQSIQKTPNCLSKFSKCISSCFSRCKKTNGYKPLDQEVKPSPPLTETKKTQPTNEVEKRFKKRVILRYCFVFWIPAILLGVFILLYFLTKTEGEFSFRVLPGSKVNVNLTRCTFEMSESQNPEQISGYSYLTYSLGSFYESTVGESNNSTQSSYLINYNESTKELNISMFSMKENSKSCYLLLNIPKNIIKDINVQCNEKCFIIQEDHIVKTENLNIISDGIVFANFHNVEVENLQFSVFQGGLQLNNFLLGKSADIDLYYGDIVLQSNQDLNVNWKNDQQTFCFASPAVNHQAISHCQISGNSSSKSKTKNESKNSSDSCQGQTLICLDENNCSPQKAASIKTSQLLGNLYINRLDQPYIDIDYVNNILVSKGAIYDEGISFEPYIKEKIQELKEQAMETATDSVFILEIGKQEMQSRSTNFWTVVSNPSFAYIRPWWLSTFSLSLLTSNSFKVAGILSPGICPYHIEPNIYDVYETERYLKNLFEFNHSVISFVEEANKETISVNHVNGTGIYIPEKNRPITEKWFSIKTTQEGDYQVHSNGIEANKFIVAALILSFIFAAFVGGTVFFLFKAAVMMIYVDTCEKSEHAKNYVEFEALKKGKKPENPVKGKPFDVKGLLEQSSLYNFMRKVPRISAFLGYYSLGLVKKHFIDSVDEFLSFLMNPNLESEQKKVDKGIGETKYLEMKEKDLKNNYEKFCFLNRLIEKPLSDKQNIKKFEEYGYTLEDEEEINCRAFTKMSLKDEQSALDRAMLTTKDSLDLFIEVFVDVTNSETDYEYVDEFAAKYYQFCDRYRLLKKEIRPDILTQNIKYKFGTTIIARKKLVKKQNLKGLEEGAENQKTVWKKLLFYFLKLITFGSYKEKTEMKFLIDEDQMKYHFNIMIKPDNPQNYMIFETTAKDDNEKSLEKKTTADSVINKMIYHSYWYYWVSMDMLMIFIQQFFTGACIMPFFFLVILQETSYAPFSLVDPLHLITKEDVLDNPWQIPNRLAFLNPWNIVIVSICIFFMVYSFLDCLLYFCVSSFPDDRSFEKNQEILERNKVLKYLSNFQWILIFFMVLCYSSYIGLVCVWLLLGAIINPNNFLVYSTAALTFLTFVSSKYSAFKKISDDGFKVIKDEVNRILQKQIKLIISFMVEEVKELTMMGKSMMQSDAAKFAFEKAKEFGLDEEISELKSLTEKTLDNPEKLVSGAIETAVSTIENPEKMIEKLKNAQQKMKDKAIEVFKNKCKANNIPEILFDLLLQMNFKDEDKIKDALAMLVEVKSEEILNKKINKELVKCILDIILPPKNIKNSEELGIIVKQELLANFMQLHLNSLVTPGVDLGNQREIILQIFALLDDIKNKNAKEGIPRINFLAKALMKKSKYLTKFSAIIDFVYLLTKDESTFKRKVMDQIAKINIPEPIGDLLTFSIYSNPDEQVLKYGNKRFVTTQNLNFSLSKIFQNYERLDGKPYSKDQTNFLSNIMSFSIKALKNQLDEDDIKKASAAVTGFLQTAVNKASNQKMYDVSEENVNKILGLVPTLAGYSKHAISFRNSLAKKYLIKEEILTQMIYILTNDYWQNFEDENRYPALKNTYLIKRIAFKLRMSESDLLGFIAIFRGDFQQKNAKDFLNGLIDYQKNFILNTNKEIMFNLLIVLLSKNSIVRHNALKNIAEDAWIKNFMKQAGMIDKKLASLLDWEDFEKENEGKENSPQKKKDILDILAENKLGKERPLERVIYDFLLKMRNLFALNENKKDDVQQELLKKNAIAEFAKEYKYDQDGLEYLYYMLMQDVNMTVNGLEYFIGDETKLFKFNSDDFENIVKTIFNEDKNYSLKSTNNFLSAWMPKEFKDSDATHTHSDIVRKLMDFNLLWNGIDLTDILWKITEIAYPDLKNEEKNLIKKRVTKLFHAEFLTNSDFCKLFPILDQKENNVKASNQNLSIENSKFIPDHFNFATFNPSFYEHYEINEVTKFDLETNEEIKKQFLTKFKALFSLLSGGNKISLVESKEIIKTVFFSDKPNKTQIPHNVKLYDDVELVQYITFFEFLNCGGKPSSDLIAYFKNNYKIDELEEMLRLIKLYFTTDSSVFSRGIITHFKEFHGKINELNDIFSICSDEPSIDSLSTILGLETSYSIEHSIHLCKFYSTVSMDGKLEILKKTSSLLESLKIDFDEFLLFYKFMINALDTSEYNKFISAFSLDKFLDNQILSSLFSFYSNPENYDEGAADYVKVCKSRQILYEKFDLNPDIGDLLCDFNSGSFINIKMKLMLTDDLKHLDIIPEKNSETIINTLSAVVGGITNRKTNGVKREELFESFIKGEFEAENNIETIAFYLFDYFEISPIFSLLSFEDELTKEHAKEEVVGKWKELNGIINEMTYEEKNQIIESDFIRLMLCYFHEEDEDDENGEKEGENFFKKISKRKKRGDNASQASSSDLNKAEAVKDLNPVEKIKEDEEEQVEAKKSFHICPEDEEEQQKEDIPQEEEEKENDESDEYDYDDDNEEASNDKSEFDYYEEPRYNECLLNAAIKYLKKNKTEKLLITGKNLESQDNKEELKNDFDIFFEEIYDKTTPNILKRKLDAYGTNFSNSIILNSFLKLNKLISAEDEKVKGKKQQAEKENEKYKRMIEFGLELDFLLTSLEKKMYMSNQYKNFENFRKNSIVKLFTHLFFYDVMDEKTDFILENFFRFSLFQPFFQVIDSENPFIHNHRLSTLEKNSTIFFTKKLHEFYLTSSNPKFTKLKINLERNIQLFLDPKKNLIHKIKKYDDLLTEINNPNSFIVPEARKNYIEQLRNLTQDDEFKEKLRKFRIKKFTYFETPELCLEDSKNLEDLVIKDDIISIKGNADASFFDVNNLSAAASMCLFKSKSDDKEIIDVLLDRLPQFLKGDHISSKEIYIKTFSIYRGLKKKDSEYKKPLEYLLSKCSGYLKSDFINLKMILELFYDKNINEEEFERSLTSIGIYPRIFYGIAIPYLKSLANKTPLRIKIINQIPNCLKRNIWTSSEINEISDKKLKFIEKKKNKKSSNQRIRDLFANTKYSSVTKDRLVIFLNAFAGDIKSWKKILANFPYFEFNPMEGAKNRSHTDDMKEKIQSYINIFNIFDSSMRKSCSLSLIKSRPITEFLNKELTPDHLSKIFPVIKDNSYDKNNLFLLMCLIDKDYSELIGLFYQLPNYICFNINFSPNSDRFYLFKLLFFVLSLSNPNIRLERELIGVLKEEIFDKEDKNDKIKKFLGLEYEFFSLIADSESGELNKILLFLAQKNDDFLLILGLSYMMNVTKLNQEYVELDNYKRGRTQDLSNIVMFTVIKLANMVFQLERNGKNLEQDNIFKTLKEKIRENLHELSEYVGEYYDCYNKNTILTLDYSEIFDGVGRDFTKFLQENIYNNDNALKRTTFRNIVKNYTKDLLLVFQQITKQMDEFLYAKNPSEQKKEENKEAEDEERNMEDIFKLFFNLFLGTSTNDDSEIIQNLIKFNDETNMINRLISNLNFSYGNNKKIINTNENKFYSLVVELLILGFGNLEKEKNGSAFSMESSLYHFFNKIKEFDIEENYKNLIEYVFFVLQSFFNQESKMESSMLILIFGLFFNEIYIPIFQKLPEELKKREAEAEKQSAGSCELEILSHEREKIKNSDLNNPSILFRIQMSNFNPVEIICLLEDINSFIKDFSVNSNEIKKDLLRDISVRLGVLLFPDNQDTQKIIESLFAIVQQDFDNVGPELFNLMGVDKQTFKTIKNLLLEFKRILEAPESFVTRKIDYLTNSISGKNISSLDVIKDKLKMDKDMEAKDLFKVFDADKSGRINIDEFKLLTKRLNMTLSDHRIREIFTSVKGEKIKESQELDEVEFEKALGYLQEKSIMLTLEYLGITKEVLFGILIWLTLLLLILFAFIFVGIAAFAVGGTFGSIINSLFPIAGGAGLSKKGSDKKEVDMEMVKLQVAKCVEIIQSFKI